MSATPVYGEKLHSPGSAPWKRNCETLCQCKSHKCRNWYEVGSSSTLGRWGKRIKERMNPLFNHDLPKKSSSDAGHLKNIKSIKAARKGLTKTAPSSREQVGYSVQAHHLLSSKKVLKNARIRELALAAAYDINNGWNCILLPSNFGRQKWDNLQRHNGNHDGKKYYDKIAVELKKAVKGFTASDYCKEDRMKKLHSNFHTKEEEIFKKFKNNSIELYFYSKDAFDRDYRSELGAGKAKFAQWVSSGSNRVLKPDGKIKNSFYTKNRFPIF